VLNNSKIVENEWYFVKFMSPIVISGFKAYNVKLDLQWAREINSQITNEYKKW